MRVTVLRPLVFALPLVLVSATASAHFTLKSPPPASKSTNGGKGTLPCGPASDSGVVTPAQGGHEIDLVVNETVNHGGFYRVALSIKSRDELPPDNVVYDSKGMVLPPSGTPKGISDHADFETTPKFPVLGDHLFPHDDNATPKEYSGKIMLPNVTCDKCTLQVIQFMAPHGYNDGGGYFYHHCADLKITADPALPAFDPKGSMGGAGGGGAGGSAGMGGNAGAATGGAGGTAPTGNGGTGGTGGTASSTAGMPGTGTAGAATSAGTANGGTAPSTGSGGAGGSGTAAMNPGGGSAEDDGGCSMGKGSRGAASLAVALGLGLSLLRRRRRAV